MTAMKITIDGLQELQARLQQLPGKIAKNALRQATSAAAATIRDEARSRAPVDTGEMRKDIQIKRERESTAYRAVYSVFVRTGKKSRIGGRARNVDKDSYYWRFVEFGTSKMAAKPFMRPAFEAKKEAAAAAMKSTLAKRIEEEANAR